MIRKQLKTARINASSVRPNRQKRRAKTAPVASSTSGYCQAIGARQRRQRRPSSTKLTSGILSYQAIVCRQRGQRDRDPSGDSPVASRTITTFRKLPTIRPKTKITGLSIRLFYLTYAQSSKRLGAGYGGGGLMENHWARYWRWRQYSWLKGALSRLKALMR